MQFIYYLSCIIYCLLFTFDLLVGEVVEVDSLVYRDMKYEKKGFFG